MGVCYRYIFNVDGKVRVASDQGLDSAQIAEAIFVFCRAAPSAFGRRLHSII